MEELTKKEEEKEKKKTPIMPPVDAEGNEIDVDSNWKKFLSKQPKRENKERKKDRKEKKEGKKQTILKTERKKESLLDEENEIRGVKKVPLKRAPLKKTTKK